MTRKHQLAIHRPKGLSASRLRKEGRGGTAGCQRNPNQRAHQTACHPYWTTAASCHSGVAPQKHASNRYEAACVLLCLFALSALLGLQPLPPKALTQQGARRQECGSNPLHNNPSRYLCLAETAPPSTCSTSSGSPRKCRAPQSNTGRARTRSGGTQGQPTARSNTPCPSRNKEG